MQKITTFLTYDNQAEEAATLYTSLFDNGRIVSASHYGDGAPQPSGSVMSVTFELAGQQFIALNGGPSFSFAPGISLFVSCETQEEIDRLWEALSEGGEEGPCGWLTDRFGVSWQIVPRVLGDLLRGEDRDRAGRAMRAMLQMRKLDIAALEAA